MAVIDENTKGRGSQQGKGASGPQKGRGGMAVATIAQLEREAAEYVAKSLAAETDLERIEWQAKARRIHAAIDVKMELAAWANGGKDAHEW